MISGHEIGLGHSTQCHGFQFTVPDHGSSSEKDFPNVGRSNSFNQFSKAESITIPGM